MGTEDETNARVSRSGSKGVSFSHQRFAQMRAKLSRTIRYHIYETAAAHSTSAHTAVEGGGWIRKNTVYKQPHEIISRVLSLCMINVGRRAPRTDVRDGAVGRLGQNLWDAT